MFVRGENTEPSEYIFDGFSYAFKCLFVDRGYMLVESAGVDQPYLRNNRSGVLLPDQPDRHSVRACVRR